MMYSMSRKPPSGGMNESALEDSYRARRMHGWKAGVMIGEGS